ncbi:hypothetical protein JXA85_06620 [Candidatus Woesearchaeota archaeon]|nr:hypothetical protein [Candidatus Woesearchaeota archaeon]
MIRKKGDLSINYIFLIFIATIAVFVIVGLITKWSLNADKLVKTLVGGDSKEDILDIQIVNVTECGTNGEYLENEIIKHAKLCYTKAKQGKVHGSLCYGLVTETICGVNTVKVKEELDDLGISSSLSAQLGQNKIIIGYSYDKGIVEIY